MLASFFKIAIVLSAFSTSLFAQTLNFPIAVPNPVNQHMTRQMNSMNVFRNMSSNLMTSKMAKDSSRKRSVGSGGNSSGRSNTPSKTNAAKADSNVVRYKESNTNTYASTLSDKGTKEVVAEMMLIYKKTAADEGYIPNDVAYAFLYFVVNNYNVYHNLVEMPADVDPDLRKAKDSLERTQILQSKDARRVSPFQEKLVYQQFKESLSADSKLLAMTDRDKQLAAENLAVLQGYVFAMYIDGLKNKDDSKIEEARRLAKVGLENLFETTIDKIQISEYGFAVN